MQVKNDHTNIKYWYSILHEDAFVNTEIVDLKPSLPASLNYVNVGSLFIVTWASF